MIDNMDEIATKLEDLMLRMDGVPTDAIKAELRKSFPHLSDDEFFRVLDYTVLKSGKDLATLRPH